MNSLIYSLSSESKGCMIWQVLCCTLFLDEYDNTPYKPITTEEMALESFLAYGVGYCPVCSNKFEISFSSTLQSSGTCSKSVYFLSPTFCQQAMFFKLLCHPQGAFYLCGQKWLLNDTHITQWTEEMKRWNSNKIMN